MDKQKSIKLHFINLLSNPKVHLIKVDFENEMITIPPDSFAGYQTRVLNGTSHYTISIYNSEKDGRKKHKKQT
jgi:hypothetical protein